MSKQAWRERRAEYLSEVGRPEKSLMRPFLVKRRRTRRARIIGILRDGLRHTSSEVAILLRISKRSAQVGLWDLQRAGKVEKSGLMIPSEYGRRPLNLFQLKAKP